MSDDTRNFFYNDPFNSFSSPYYPIISPEDIEDYTSLTYFGFSSPQKEEIKPDIDLGPGLRISANSSSMDQGQDQDHEVKSRMKEYVRRVFDDDHKIDGGDQSANKVEKGMKKKEREARFAFVTRSEVDHLDDGYKWRKYGQKSVKNSPFPRSYYRCTTQKCGVKKLVERSYNDPSTVITTYEGQHNHPLPVSRGGLIHTSTLQPPDLLSQSVNPSRGILYDNVDLGGTSSTSQWNGMSSFDLQEQFSDFGLLQDMFIKND
ncbi:WRKY transcription factor 71-like [Impatiens glandulifera]|uniref:WRKY transcription factor 71-like n=1 Tax=Impatiens glandulifera TaxID=253017 RepID=UPI001FB0A630|nr:WRKY transcription factor 71-like [Impatiens glandulifera]